MSGTPDEDRGTSPKHDPFDGPDAEDGADTRERVLEAARSRATAMHRGSARSWG